MQPTSDSIYNIGKRLEQLAALMQATKDYQHPHKQLYTEQEMNTLKRLFMTYELNETVIYEGQVVQMVKYSEQHRWICKKSTTNPQRSPT